MNVLPIPDELLGGSITLLAPTTSGFEQVDIENVRISRKSVVSDYTATRMRDAAELTVHFDCVNSRPLGQEFSAGMLAEDNGETYELLRAELFSADRPHHWVLKFRKIDSGNDT